MNQDHIVTMVCALEACSYATRGSETQKIDKDYSVTTGESQSADAEPLGSKTGQVHQVVESANC